MRTERKRLFLSAVNPGLITPVQSELFCWHNGEFFKQQFPLMPIRILLQMMRFACLPLLQEFLARILSSRSFLRREVSFLFSDSHTADERCYEQMYKSAFLPSLWRTFLLRNRFLSASPSFVQPILRSLQLDYDLLLGVCPWQRKN